MLKKIETREAISFKVYDAMKAVKAMLKEKEALTEEWENKVYSAEAEVITCEDLIFFYDTPDMNAKLAKAYNRLRHYQYIYHKLVNECEELEQALIGLEKADYWL